MLVLYSMIAVLFGANAHAAGPTIVSGGNLGSTTWIAADSPYVIEGDATVEAGATLTIEAGVEVRFASTDGQTSGLDTADVELTIAGSLNALGTPGNPIAFKADSGTAEATWYGLVFTDTAASITLTNATIQHAQYGIRTDAVAASVTNVAVDTVSEAGLFSEGGDPTVEGLTVTEARYGVQLVDDGSISLSNCLIYNNSSYGIFVANDVDIGLATFDHCTIDDNYYGFYSSGSNTSDYEISNSNITNNTYYGVRRSGNNEVFVRYSNTWGNPSENLDATTTDSTSANPLYLAPGSDLTLTENSPSRFLGSDGLDAGASWLAYRGDPTPGLYGTLWTDTNLTTGIWDLEGDLTVAPGVTLTIDPGATLRWAADTDIMEAYADPARGELRIEGTLRSLGLPGMEVLYESTGSSPSNWYGLHFLSSASGGLFFDGIIAEAVYGIRYSAAADNPIDTVFIDQSGQAGVMVDLGSPALNAITATNGEYGVHYTEAGGGTLDNCLIYNNNSYGIYATNNTNVGTIDIEHCTIDGNLDGFRSDNSSGSEYDIIGSNITNNVDYGVFESGNNDVYTRYSNVWGNPTPSQDVLVSHNEAANPLYVAAGSDYTLTENSPSRFLAPGNADSGPDFLAYSGDPTPGLYGTLWTDRTLSAGVHNLDGDLTVAPGVTLTIDPGATLVWTGWSDIMGAYSLPSHGELRVAGTLLSLGEAGNEVVYDSTLDNWGTWGGIHFLSTAAGGQFSHGIIRGAVTGILHGSTADNPIDHLSTDKNSVGVRVESGSPDLTHITLTNGSSGVVFAYAGAGNLSDCLIYDNTNYGISGQNSFDIGIITIDHCTIDGNVTGFHSNSQTWSDYHITNSNITNNTYGVNNAGNSWVTASNSNIWNNGTDISNAVVSDNTSANPLYLTPGADYTLTSNSPSRFIGNDGLDLGPGALAYAGDATPGLYGTLWTDTELTAGFYAMVGDLTVAPGVTLTVESGVTMDFAEDSDIMGAYADREKGEIRIEGTALFEGERASPILLRSTGGADGGWSGVSFLSTAVDSVFQHVHIDEAVIGVRYDAVANNPIEYAVITNSSVAGIQLEGGAPLVDGVRISDGFRGIQLTESGGGTVQNSVIHDNDSYGVHATNNTDIGVATFTNCTLDDNNMGFFANNDTTSEYELRNVSVTNNLAYGVRSIGLNTVRADYCNIWNSGVPTGGVQNNNNLAVDPLYVGVSNFKLQPTSPNIDAGSAVNAPDHDFSGELRPNDGDGLNAAEYDIGAYEYKILVPGITLSPSDLQHTDESGGTAEFTVVLDSPPVGSVLLMLASSDTTEGTVSPLMMAFNDADWDVPRLVTVTGVDDAIDDGDVAYQIELDPSNSTAPGYQALPVVAHAMINDNDDVPSILVTPSEDLQTTEAGGQVVVDVVLGLEPIGDVQIDLASTDETEGTVAPPVLSFDATDWDVPQQVTITGVDDVPIDGDVAYQIRMDPALSGDLAYGALPIVYLDVLNLDDDLRPPAITVSEVSQSTSESGGFDTFTVVLDSEPTDTVTIAVGSDDPTEGVTDLSQLNFQAGDWNIPQLVTVTGIDDAIADGDVQYAVVLGPVTGNDGDYTALDPADIVATNTDDDAAGILVSRANVTTTEGGMDETFTVSLTSEPTATVTINLSSSNPNEATLDVAAAVFDNTDWMNPVLITVSPVNDAIDDGDQPYTVVVGPVTSSDAAYAAIDPPDISGTNADDDDTGVLVSRSDVATTEGGGDENFTLVLTSEPTSPVTIEVSSSDTSEATVDLAAVVFDDSDWMNPVVVTLSPVDDAVADGDQPYTIVVGPVTGGDPAYVAIDPRNLSGTNADDDAVAVQVSRSEVTTTEGGIDQTFAVVLGSEPTASVTIDVASSDTDEATVDLPAVVFDSNDWMVPVLVTVSPVDDALDDGDQPYTVEIGPITSADAAYAAIDPPDIAGTNIDDDGAAVLVSRSEVTTSEAGNNETFTVVLTSEPSASVTVDVSSSDPSEVTVDLATVVFGSGDWMIPVLVTISPVDDAIDDGDQPYTIEIGPITSADADYAALNPPDIAGTNLDDDGAGVVVSRSDVTTSEGGMNEDFTVVLTSEPSSSVSIDVSSSDPSEATVDLATVVFDASDWMVPVVVTLSPVDDAIDDGDQPYTIEIGPITSADAGYAAIDPQDIAGTNLDDDRAGVVVSRSDVTTSEGGRNEVFTLVLTSEPTASVSIDVSSSDPSEATVDLAAVVFDDSDWMIPVVVTISPVDDLVDDGDVPYSIAIGPITSMDAGYASIDPLDIAGVNTDDDGIGVLVSRYTVTTAEGGIDETFSVVLASEPTADVRVQVSSSDTSEATVDRAFLTFTTLDWAVEQIVTVSPVDDNIVDGDQAYTVVLGPVTSPDADYSAIDPQDVSGTNTDDDSAAVLVSRLEVTTTEGGPDETFTVVLTSEPVSPVSIAVASTDPGEATVDLAAVMFDSGDWMIPVVVSISPVNDAVIDGDQSYAIEIGPVSGDPSYADLDPQDIAGTNLDNGVAIIVSRSTVTTTEGGIDETFSVVLGAAPTATVTVDIASSDTDEATLDQASLVFTALDWMTEQIVTVSPVDDAVQDGDQPYTVEIGPVTSSDASYDGLDPADISGTNLDNDTARILTDIAAVLITGEDGAAAGFDVWLSTEPTATVILDVSSTDLSEGLPAPSTLTFTSLNWFIPQPVTVSGVDDAVDDGDISYDVGLSVTAGDAVYLGIGDAYYLANNVDDDGAGILVDPVAGLFTAEFGSAANFDVVLLAEPSGDVEIDLASDDPGEGLASPAQLTFTAANWDTPQQVTVTGVDDALIDGDVDYNVVTAPARSSDVNFDGLDPEDVRVTNLDDDASGFLVTPIEGLITSEDGGQDSFDVVLLGQPASDVTVLVTSDNAQEGSVNPPLLTFTAGNWSTPQTVVVTGEDDEIADGDVVFVVSMSSVSSDLVWDGLQLDTVEVTNIDDDPTDTDTDTDTDTPPTDTGTPPTDTGHSTDKDPGACGCNSGAGPARVWWVLGLAVALGRRRSVTSAGAANTWRWCRHSRRTW